MKLFIKNGDIVGAIKAYYIAKAMANTRIYELLHKQLWRKASYRIKRTVDKNYLIHNGRPVVFISLWNIKSYSSAPYSYDGGDHTFGLNQLFVGQDYRKAYVGNPKKGIYHDDCYIQPKQITDATVFDLTSHGEVIKEVSVRVGLWKPYTYAWTKYFSDGFVLYYTPQVNSMSDRVRPINEHYEVRVMMYADDGELCMNHSQFIEKWNDYFELIVREDSEWWSGLIAPIVAIVIAVVAYYTGYNASPLLQALIYSGGALSAIGVLSGNQKMMNIGSILGIVGAVNNVVANTAKEAAIKASVEKGFSIASIEHLSENYIKDATFSTLFKDFVSGAGMTNWLEIGGKGFTFASNLQSLGVKDYTTSETEKEESNQVVMFSNDEDDYVSSIVDI